MPPSVLVKVATLSRIVLTSQFSSLVLVCVSLVRGQGRGCLRLDPLLRRRLDQRLAVNPLICPLGFGRFQRGLDADACGGGRYYHHRPDGGSDAMGVGFAEAEDLEGLCCQRGRRRAVLGALRLDVPSV